MSIEYKSMDVSLLAGEDLSGDQYHAVIISSGTILRPNGAGAAVMFGVLQNAPISGEYAVVRIEGISKIVAGSGGLDEGDLCAAEYVGATDAGKGIATTTDKHFILGITILAGASEDDLASIHLTKSFHSV